MRGIVRRELLGYYFDHTEHSRDVQAAMHEAGYDFDCDAHGVGAYFSRVAGMETVRSVFDGISNVPGRMELKTFMHAVDAAYVAAKQEGHGSNLREFEEIKEAISGSVARSDGELAIGAGEENISIPLASATHSIVSVVNIVYQHQNAMGVRLPEAELDRIVKKIEAANPSTIRKLFTDWLPSALVGASVPTLIETLVLLLG